MPVHKSNFCLVIRYVLLVLSGVFDLLLVACAASEAPEDHETTEVASPAASSETTNVPQRVDVGGYALLLSCTGTGEPTVILESGLGADHTTWAQIQPDIAAITQVCSYDRAGLGQSDEGPTPRTSQQIAIELDTLLTTAQVPGPYILVAHSFGGLHARYYAHTHPDQVAGIVLIDAIHEDWWSRALALLPPAEPDENKRLHDFRQYLTEDVYDATTNDEGLDIPNSAGQVRETGSLGAIPLVVLTAGRTVPVAPGLPPELEAELVKLAQQDLQAELATLSSNNTHIMAAESGHMIHQDAPDVVLAAIRAVLNANRATPQ